MQPGVATESTDRRRRRREEVCVDHRRCNMVALVGWTSSSTHLRGQRRHRSRTVPEETTAEVEVVPCTTGRTTVGSPEKKRSMSDGTHIAAWRPS